MPDSKVKIQNFPKQRIAIKIFLKILKGVRSTFPTQTLTPAGTIHLQRNKLTVDVANQFWWWRSFDARKRHLSMQQRSEHAQWPPQRHPLSQKPQFGPSLIGNETRYRIFDKLTIPLHQAVKLPLLWEELTPLYGFHKWSAVPKTNWEYNRSALSS